MSHQSPRNASAASMAIPATRGGSGGRAQTPRWLRGKRPVFQFVGLFLLFMGMYFALTWVPAVNRWFLQPNLRLSAKMSTAILNVFGEGATANGTAITSSRFGVDISKGCDAIEPSALFVAAVLAFPAPWLTKLPGLLAGTVVIAMINLFRIVSLFYCGIHFGTLFDLMHEDIWQPIFVMLALALWVMWAWWATKRSRAPAHVST